MAHDVLDVTFHRSHPGGKSAVIEESDRGETTADLPWRRRWRRRFYHRLLIAVAASVAGLPEAPGRGLCQALALTALALRAEERGRADRNVTLALPHLDRDARHRLVWRCAAAMGRNLHTALRLVHWAAADFRRVRTAPSPGPGGVDALEWIRRLRVEGRGVLLLTGHLGCWELLGGYLARRLDGLTVVTGTVHNAPVDAWIQDRRRALGLKVLPRDEGARPLLESLRGGEVVAVLLDQNTRVPSEPVPFLGRPAPTATALAKLAIRHQIPVLPVAIASVGDGHEVRCLRPLRIALPSAELGSGDAVRALARKCNDALGELIRRNPVEWVWFHDRWDDDQGNQRMVENRYQPPERGDIA